MKPTINDIARISGFSKTTVSFAFNDPTRISKDTRGKIIAIAEELGYVPDPVARNLSMRKLGTIGFLIPQEISVAFLNPYIGEIFRGIGHVCESDGHSVTVIPPRRGQLFEGAKSAAVDGFVALGLMPYMKTVQLIRHRHVPFVTIDGVAADDIPSVNVDDTGAATRVMRHVLEQGHRHIGILSFCSPTTQGEAYYSGIGELRLRGFAEALREQGLSLAADTVHIVECDCSQEGGRDGARELLTLAPETTAIVTMSDIMAVGAYDAAHALARRVPTELSVSGFDDIPLSRLLEPGLTTIEQPGFQKGVAAGELLFRLLHGEETAEHRRFEGKLVERGSVASLERG
ncbi:MAG: substrate-binding domain-containing protein [Spirochaetes bacterium]|jgi:DNA-binding LacI/PurR family transcriptional regulator|nr:substrate-binding domain-containing protein [Spirochaetota bacterium]